MRMGRFAIETVDDGHRLRLRDEAGEFLRPRRSDKGGRVPAFADVLLGGTVQGILTWLGFIMGGTGLYMTYHEARGAQAAARAAVQAFSRRGTVGDLAHALGLLANVRQLIQDDNLKEAWMLWPSIKRSVWSASETLRSHAGPSVSLVQVRRNMAIVDHQLAAPLSGPVHFARPETLTALSEIEDFLGRCEAQLTQDGSG